MERPSELERGQGAEGFEENDLSEVLGLVAVADQAEQEGINAALMPLQQSGIAGFVARQAAADEVGVRVEGFAHGTSYYVNRAPEVSLFGAGRR